MRITNVQPTPLSAPTSTGGRRPAEVLSELPWTVFEALRRWQVRAESRRHLATLDDRLLADVGLDRDDVARELAKPFWRA